MQYKYICNLKFLVVLFEKDKKEKLVLIVYFS